MFAFACRTIDDAALEHVRPHLVHNRFRFGQDACHVTVSLQHRLVQLFAVGARIADALHVMRSQASDVVAVRFDVRLAGRLLRAEVRVFGAKGGTQQRRLGGLLDVDGRIEDVCHHLENGAIGRSTAGGKDACTLAEAEAEIAGDCLVVEHLALDEGADLRLGSGESGGRV